MKLTVDCVFTTELAQLPSASALAYLLARGKMMSIAQPLETLLCKQFGLTQAGDFAVAALCADADGLQVTSDYWLRADPVHLLMQRDSFSLSEPVPMTLAPKHASQILTTLNQHFALDGLTFLQGQSGAWYVRVQQPQRLTTTLPSVAMDKNVHHFMPQGADSAKWKAVLNEAQMLLHEHPANREREANGELAVNSIWLSGAGPMPVGIKPITDFNLLLAHSPLYEALAKQTGVAYQAVTDFASLLKTSATQVRVQLPVTHDLDKKWFSPLVSAIKAKKISQITLNLGYYEQCLVLTAKPLDLYKFWRKTKPVSHYLV